MIRYLVHHQQVRQHSPVQDRDRSGKRPKAADNVSPDRDVGEANWSEVQDFELSALHPKGAVNATRSAKSFRAFRDSGIGSELDGSHSRVRMMRTGLGPVANSQRYIERFSDGA